MRPFITRLLSVRGRLSTVGILGSFVTYGVLTACHMAGSAQSQVAGPMFSDRSDLLPHGTRQLNYGVAVADVDGDGELEWIVAGFNGSNIVLKLDRSSGRYYNLIESDSRYAALADPGGAAIGVCACDVDGDGREEIYFLNTNNRYSGPKLYKDKLFKWRRGRDGREQFEDLFSDPGNDAALSMFAGRSVAAIDRKGTGKYSVILATYARDLQGSFGLIEMDESQSDVPNGHVVLRNAAHEAGIDMTTGGRGITVGPITGSGHSDIFFDNEGYHAPRANPPENALFVNDGYGRFTNLAAQKGLDDEYPGRGVALADFNNDGRLDIVYGNWNRPHKIMLQQSDGTFRNAAGGTEFATPSPIRTVIAADFDNDGETEVFLNNIAYRGASENGVYRVTPSSDGRVTINKLNVGDAIERFGHGTGGAVSDMDGDGQLELMLSHGESLEEPLSLYHVNPGSSNGWLRVMPLTPYGAPARGAMVIVTLDDGRQLTRVVDAGSGYLCQMEPVAHFGLGNRIAQRVVVVWPGGSYIEQELRSYDQNRVHMIPYPHSTPSHRGPGYQTWQGREQSRRGQEPHSGQGTHTHMAGSQGSNSGSSRRPGIAATMGLVLAALLGLKLS